MSFWDKVRTDLSKAVHESWEAVKGGAKIAAEKSEGTVKTSKLRYKAHLGHKKAENLFTDLGGIVYDMARPPYENPLSRPEVMSLVEKIKAVEEETAKVEEEIEKVKLDVEWHVGGGTQEAAPEPEPTPEPKSAPKKTTKKTQATKKETPRGTSVEAPKATKTTKAKKATVKTKKKDTGAIKAKPVKKAAPKKRVKKEDKSE